MVTLNNIKKSKIMACVASLHPGRTGTCLDFDKSVAVIRASAAGSLVYHVPVRDMDQKAFSEYHWSFPMLLRHLGDTSMFDILVNTSGATDASSAVSIARDGVLAFATIASLCPHQSNPIIKLEVLNKDLYSNDTEAIRASKELMAIDKLTVIPLVSANIDSVIKCAEVGVPMVRVLSGAIGTMGGIIDERLLGQIIRRSPIPVIVEGGIGTVGHVMQAFRLGATAVLMNSAFRNVSDPIQLALDIRQAIDSLSSHLSMSRAYNE